MPMVDASGLISVTEANRLGVSSLVRDVEEGRDRILLRNNKPVAAVVSMERLERWEEMESFFVDLTITIARAVTTNPDRHSLDEVLERFGLTRDDFRNTDR